MHPRADAALSSAFNMQWGEQGCQLGMETSSTTVQATYIHLREDGYIWSVILPLINRHL